MCNNGKLLVANKQDNITVENMGQEINTHYPEYAPVMNKNKDVLIFTSRNNGNTGGKFHHDNKAFEDIYMSTFSGNSWSNASKVDSTNKIFSGKINSKYHDAAISYSLDESKFYLYRKNNVWVSELSGGKYQDPKQLGKTINNGDHQPSAFLTPDGKTLFVTSNRQEGGFGGRDLWKSSLKEDGTWGELENLGPNINTEFDEDAPFLTSDGKVLFFSSNGHNTMGGYDIFKSVLQDDGTWSKPENLGSPINTPADDIYYIQDEAEEMAYFSSSRMGGYGDMDIYGASLLCKNIPNTEVRGVILAAETYAPVKAKFTVYNTKNNEQVGTFESDPRNGKYLLILPPDNTYRLEFIAEGFEAERAHREEFTIPRQCEYYQLFQEVYITRIKNDENLDIAQEAKFNNAMFDIKKEATDLYGLNDFESKVVTENTATISGNIIHTEKQKASEVEIMLLNSNNEIVRSQTTSTNGSFAFAGLDTNETYRLVLNEESLQQSFYGNNLTEWNNSVIAKGNIAIQKISPTGQVLMTEPLISNQLLLVNKTNSIVSTSNTDKAGNFTLENVTKYSGEQPNFVYKLHNQEEDAVYSLFIRNLDENSDLLYTQVIDRIDFKTPTKPSDIIAFENIYFDFDKHFIRDKDKDIMKKIANYMSSNPQAKIVIMGHTDWYGTDQYNMALSKRRATSAQKYLQDNNIAQNRVKLEWYGESRPAVPNADPNGKDLPENRQLNRRCEFKIQMSDMAYITISY
jgi:outer membrane protein OmpA-like peptidoglycan-associated protein